MPPHKFAGHRNYKVTQKGKWVLAFSKPFTSLNKDRKNHKELFRVQVKAHVTATTLRYYLLVFHFFDSKILLVNSDLYNIVF